ncbi:MAG: rRNA maturation RNase YbeY [Ignavibacteria bacterium]|nr:rRNA maturation RNase YbeY [Ignavibacteria bacterium]
MPVRQNSVTKPEISITYEKKIFNSDEKLFLKQRINKIIELLSDFEDFNITELNFLFCTDELITEYNKKYLRHDFATDIITFEYNDEEGLVSDVIISTETVKKNSKVFKTEYLNELTRVIIHGLLHLCGYKDKTAEQKKTMRLKENFFLKKI